MTDNARNTLQQDKFKVVIHRFPNLEIFVQTAPIPGFRTDSVHRPTNAPHDYFEIGDKIKFNDLVFEFILDQDLQIFEEIFQWSNDAMTKSRKDFNPFSDMTMLIFDNNSTRNLSIIFKNCFPEWIGDINFTSISNESGKIIMNVGFKYSSYEIRRNYNET